MYWNWCLFHCLIFWDLFSYGLSAATTRDAGKGLLDNYGPYVIDYTCGKPAAGLLPCCSLSSYTNLVLVWLRTKIFGQERVYTYIHVSDAWPSGNCLCELRWFCYNILVQIRHWKCHSQFVNENRRYANYCTFDFWDDNTCYYSLTRAPDFWNFLFKYKYTVRSVLFTL